MRKLLVLTLCIVNAFGWEINTHRAIEREAVKNAVNFSKFVESSGIKWQNYRDERFEGYRNPKTHQDYTYINYILKGERNGISADKWDQNFTDTKYQSLIEAGAILEDAQWPHWWIKEHIGWWDQADGRFNNHFADPQNGYKG